jgi:hypothetical protein
MEIKTEIPLETIRQQNSHNLRAMTNQELTIGFDENVRFCCDDVVLMTFSNAPLLGFATDFAIVLNEVWN